MNRWVSERFGSGKSVLPEADEKHRYADVMAIQISEMRHDSGLPIMFK